MPEGRAHYIRHFTAGDKVALCGFRFKRGAPLRVNAFLGSSGHAPCKKCYERIGQLFERSTAHDE